MHDIYRIAAAIVAVLLLLGTANCAQPRFSEPQNLGDCPETRAPVCASKDGDLMTYWNACKAGRANAYVINEGEWCPVRNASP